MTDDESRVGAAGEHADDDSTRDGDAGGREPQQPEPEPETEQEATDGGDDDGDTAAPVGLDILDSPDAADTESSGDTEASGAPDAPPVDPKVARRARRRRRIRITLISALVSLLSLVLLGAGGIWWVVQHYTSRVQRIHNAFPNIPDSQLPLQGKGTNFVLVGLDARSDLPTTGHNAKAPLWQYGAQRSDTTMLLHISADNSHVSIISIPRDSWVDIPGHGQAKINAAFSWGGPPLLIDTIQRMTDIRIDHFAAIDWAGFKDLTDALGGVDIDIAQDLPADPEGHAWTAGWHHMNGADALEYVRERHSLPNGDLGREQRQQNFMRAIMTKLFKAGSLTDPFKLKNLLDALTSTISVDDRFSNSDLRDFAWSLRNLHGGDVSFLTAPVSGFQTIDGQDAVVLAPNQSAELWQFVNEDEIGVYIGRHPDSELPDQVR